VSDEFRPVEILRALRMHDVDFVVIGGFAGIAHGSAYPTFDLDVAYSRDESNLEHLADALRNLAAKLRGAPADVRFQLDARTLGSGSNFTFTTPFGSLDVFGEPVGAPPYERLKADSSEEELDGERVRIASLDHLIAMKEAAGRTKDKLMATEYRVLSDLLRAPHDQS
jgi:hypothetical protein